MRMGTKNYNGYPSYQMTTELNKKGNAITQGWDTVTDLVQLANGEKTFLAGQEYLCGHFMVNVQPLHGRTYDTKQHGVMYCKKLYFDKIK